MTKAKTFIDSMKNTTALRTRVTKFEVIHRRRHIPMALINVRFGGKADTVPKLLTRLGK
jgi:hypothetical protein